MTDGFTTPSTGPGMKFSPFLDFCCKPHSLEAHLSVGRLGWDLAGTEGSVSLWLDIRTTLLLIKARVPWAESAGRAARR